MSRFSRKLVSLLGIFAVLFAQLAVSVYACPMQFMEPDDATMVMEAPEATSGERHLQSPALCQKHCENAQQNVSDAPQPLIFSSLEPAFIVAAATDPNALLPDPAPTPFLLHATSPPLSIRNCCFRL